VAAQFKQSSQYPRGEPLVGSWWVGRITSWLQDAAVKIGFILPSPVTSSTRDFGVSRSKRRPDVRFCGTVLLQLTKRLEPRSNPRRLLA
jgi:hypothetical protein